MKRNIIPLCFLVAVLLWTAGCQGLNTWEKQAYRNLEMQGAPEQETYSPVLAGILNILPGGGDAYLGQWGAFVGNLLLWPYSVVWGIPEAAITASNMNKKETVYFYLMGPGKGEFEIDGPGKKVKPVSSAQEGAAEKEVSKAEMRQ